MRKSTKRYVMGNSTFQENLTVLMPSYEVAPFYKRGGLGDVIGSLPQSLRKLGIDVRVVMPYYLSIRRHYQVKKLDSFSVVFAGKEETIDIYQDFFPESKTPIYFLGNHRLISVINLKHKRIQEFAFFDLAVVAFINWFENKGDFIPKIVHCNDWHTALIPLLLKKRMQSSIKTLLTIHNLGYQGKGSISILDDLAIGDEEIKVLKRKEEVGELNALGEGIMHADIISTVSPTYAQEILNTRSKKRSISEYLHQREKERKVHGKIVGILNGIDYSLWSPERDSDLVKKYTVETFLAGKRENKKSVTSRLKLSPDRPLVVFIGRYAQQKGIDLVKEAAKELTQMEISIALLGSAVTRKIENDVKQLEKHHPGFIHVTCGYDEELAHQLYAAADFLLIPSHYEPCGLIQMIAMRYGTLPIAAKTGGLLDSIQDDETGFLFKTGSSRDLVRVMKHAIDVFSDKERYTRMVMKAMLQDFSWDKSALEYKKLYSDLINSTN